MSADARIAANTASIQTEATARANADTALSNSITTLTASVNSNTAAIQTEQTARANADTALSNSITTLTASVNSNTAAIQTEQTARANADSALSSSITTVQATANAKNKTYRQTTAPTSGMSAGDVWYDSDDNNKPYRYDGSSWVLSADARIAANTASIQTEATTRAYETGELYAQYTVKIDAGGKVSGYGLASTGPTGTGSVFEIRADKVAFAAPYGVTGTSIVPFAVDTTTGRVAMDGAYMKTATINTAQIKDLAVTDAKVVSLTVAKVTSGIFSGKYVELASGGNIRCGQTAFNTGTGFWLGEGTDGYARMSIGTSTGNGFDYDQSTGNFNIRGKVKITDGSQVGGDAVFINGSSVSCGQTGFNTGTGFWLGKNSSGMAQLSIGSPTDNGIDWDQSTGKLNIRGDVEIANPSAFVGQLNIIDSTKWNLGTWGNQPGFTMYGETYENSIISAPGPYGDLVPVWRASPGYNGSTSGNNDGGFYTDQFYIDYTKAYRFTVWVYRTGELTGSINIGCLSNSVIRLGETSPESSPWFWGGLLPQGNKWYIIVGYIYPSSFTTGQHGDSGLYDGETGEKVASGTSYDFKHVAGQQYQSMRILLWASVLGVNVYFHDPKVEVIGANTRSIASLAITNAAAWSSSLDRTKIDGGNIYTRSVIASALASKTITSSSGVIGDLAVDTLQIAGRAATVPTVSVANAALAIPVSPSYATTHNITVNAYGGQPITLAISFVLSAGGNQLENGSVSFSLDLIKDGTAVVSNLVFATLRYATRATMAYQYVDSSPAAGAHNYLVRVYANVGEAGTASYRVVTALEAKR